MTDFFSYIIIVIYCITVIFNFMRNVINISLPEVMAKQLKREIKTGGYASTSEFFRHLLRLWNTRQLATELKKDRKEFEAGRGVKLNSMADLV